MTNVAPGIKDALLSSRFTTKHDIIAHGNSHKALVKSLDLAMDCYNGDEFKAIQYHPGRWKKGGAESTRATLLTKPRLLALNAPPPPGGHPGVLALAALHNVAHDVGAAAGPAQPPAGRMYEIRLDIFVNFNFGQIVELSSEPSFSIRILISLRLAPRCVKGFE